MSIRLGLMIVGYLVVAGALLWTMLVWGWLAMVVTFGAVTATALATLEFANARFRKDTAAVIEVIQEYELQSPSS